MDVFSNAAQPSGMKKLVAAAILSPEMHPDRVGERITAIRETLNMTKAAFADSIALDRSTLTKVEAGTKGLDIAMGAKIADLYGIGLDFIYRGILSDAPLEIRAALAENMHAARTAKAAAKLDPKEH